MLKVFGHYSGTEEETELLLNMVSEKGLSNELVKPPLYDKNTSLKKIFQDKILKNRVKNHFTWWKS